MRWRLLLTAALVAAVLLWVWATGEDQEAPTEGEAETTDEARAEPTLRGVDSHGAPRGCPDGAALGESAGHPADTPRTPLKGTLRLVDEQGRVIETPTGTLFVRVEPEVFSPEVLVDAALVCGTPIEVVEGAWTLERTGRVWASPLTFETGDRYGYLEEGIDLEEAETLAVEVTLLPRTRLHVVDARSGAPLSGVRLVRPLHGDRRENGHPGRTRPDDVLVADGTSPLVVPARGSRDDAYEYVVYAAAPGYAYGRVTLDLLAGGERTVRLQPAGALQVVLAGETDLDDLRLCGWRVEDDPETSVPYFDVSCSNAAREPIRQLAPGTYRMRVLLGSSWSERARLADVPFTVAAGKLAQVTLHVRRPPEVRLVPAAGVLHLDPAWDMEELTLMLSHLGGGVGVTDAERSFGRWGDGKLEAVPGKASTWRFNMGSVAAGRYHVTILPVGHQSAIQVPEAGSQDLRIDVGAPATMSVRIQDLPDGERSEARAAHWWMEPPTGNEGHSPDKIEHPHGQTYSEFRVPPGTICLQVASTWHTGSIRRVDVRPGQHLDVTLDVTPSGRVAITLREGQARVPVDYDWVEDVRAVDGDGESVVWAHRDGAYCIWVTKPGRYRVSFHEIPGYAPVEAREVAIEAGKTTPLEIELKRK